MITNLRILLDGFFVADKSLLTYGRNFGVKYPLHIKSLLVQTEKDNILIDTGMSGYSEAWKVTKTTTLLGSLAEAGLAPEDITMVINTHLHLDHCGHNSAFPQATFYCQRKELISARNPPRIFRPSYKRDIFDQVEYTVLDKDTKLSEDIELLFTPGHSVGHQSVLLHAPGQDYLYCGDVCPLRENYLYRLIPAIKVNTLELEASLERLKSIPALPIFSHDKDQLTLDYPPKEKPKDATAEPPTP